MDALSLVQFIRHGCICFSNGQTVVYVDPFLLPENAPAADLIFITHSHQDHYSPDDLKKIIKPDTQFVTTREVAPRLVTVFGVHASRIITMELGINVSFSLGASAWFVPAVNQNHPEGFGFGIVLTFGGAVYYISGDTDTLEPDVACDVAFVVCDGIWNMPGYEQTVPAQLKAMQIKPALVAPYHYGAYAAGTEENGRKLCEALTKAGIACRELPQGFAPHPTSL